MLQMTDARFASELADAVVLVARAGQTSRDALIEATERFGEDGVRVIGAVLNAWDPRQSRSRYYSGSYYKNYASSY